MKNMTAQNNVNYVKGFTYVFQDPAWIKKVFIGSLVTAIPIVEAISDGYQIQTIKNIRAGNPKPLPEWDDITGFFKQGVTLRIAIYAIYIPTLITIILAIASTFAGLMSWFIEDANTVQWIQIFRRAGWIFIPIIDGLVLVLLPIVLLVVPILSRRVADGDSFISLFNPFPSLKIIFSNFGSFVLSRVSVLVVVTVLGLIGLAVELIPIAGIILGWIIISVARFWGRLMWAYYLAPMKREPK